MSWRCHRSRASGRTRKVCHLRLGSSWARRPGRARSASKRGWPTWRCSYGELVAQDQDLDVLVTSGSEVKDDQLEGGSTSLADQMSVDLIGDLVHGGTVAEVDVIDDAQFLERCQVSVDG